MSSGIGADAHVDELRSAGVSCSRGIWDEFRSKAALEALYQHLVRTAVHTVKAENVATFLGRKLIGNYRDEMGNDLGKRIGGTHIKHSMGPASIKTYDKRGIILRLETTTNNVGFFKHFRTVQHQNGERSSKISPMRKSICNLSSELSGIMRDCNRRCVEFLASLEDPSVSVKALDKVTGSVCRDGRNYRGEFNISGFRNQDIRRHLQALSPGQVSHRLKRLRVHGLIKKVTRSYKYHLT